MPELSASTIWRVEEQNSTTFCDYWDDYHQGLEYLLNSMTLSSASGVPQACVPSLTIVPNIYLAPKSDDLEFLTDFHIPVLPLSSRRVKVRKKIRRKDTTVFLPPDKDDILTDFD